MNGLIWVFSIVLAVVFLATGVTKAVFYQKSMNFFSWVEDVPRPLVQLIGALEIAGALGMVLPAATGVYPILSVYAAGGLAILMLSAATFQRQRGDRDAAALAMLLLAMTSFVAYGHWTLLP